MAVISDVGTGRPGAGYDTLNEWWADVFDANDPAQWARCWPGDPLTSGDGTLVDMTNAVATADEHPRIFMAEGYGHRGVIPSNPSTFGVIAHELTIHQRFFGIGPKPGASEVGEGMYFRNTAGRCLVLVREAAGKNDATGTIVDGNLFHVIDPEQASGIAVQIVSAAAAPGLVVGFNRNIVYVEGTPQSFTSTNSAVLIACSGANARLATTFDHNTIIVNSESAANDVEYAVRLAASTASQVFLFTGRNNYVSNTNGDAWASLTGAGTFTLTVSNNGSDDGTADSILGGSNNVINAAPADLFKSATSNWRPKKGSALIDAGASSITDEDALMAPWGNTPEIGALKYLSSGGGFGTVSAAQAMWNFNRRRS